MKPEDWDKLEGISYSKVKNERDRVSKKHKVKFEKLYEAVCTAAPRLDLSRVVINRTDRVLTEDETSVLARGVNFAIVPRRVPNEEIIAGTEAAIRNLSDEGAEDIRIITANILNKARPPKCNISKREIAALKNLNSDESITILPTDKVNTTVILKTEEYNNKIEELLDPANTPANFNGTQRNLS
nr:uncharacterized protein LOC111515239 [Leptinotarsa decemlineata]